MPTQVNYPLTKTVVSAEGSAEVIAYGSNDYTAKWSVNTDSDWSLWDTFPTVVRVGNYVWCWRETTENHTWYVLIDIVEDVDNEFGANLAYPEITNTATDSIVNVLDRDSATISISTLTDGPYRPLAIGNKVLYSSTGISAGFRSNIRSIDQFTPVLNNGTIESFHIGCNNANVSNIPEVRGWGSDATKKGTNGDTRHGLFAPFATQQQFETLYGKEHNWQTPVSGNVWLFEAESGSGLGVYSGALTYPFTVAAMVPNTKYRNIPGDTNGDGFDNTPSFEDALATYAVAASVFPGLDITKCGNLADLGLKIGDIDIPSINELKNSVKAAAQAAVDSTGLSKIDEMVQGFKAGLNDMLPDTTVIENLAQDLNDLKDEGEDAYQKIIEKWDGLVDDIEGVIDSVRNLGGFDICQFVTDKAKTDENGKLVKKDPAPSPPDRDIVPGEKGFINAMPQDTIAQDDVQQSTGYNEEMARKARELYNEEWRKLLLDPFIQYGSQSSNSGSTESISDVDQAGIDLAKIIPDIPESFDGLGAFTSNSAADYIDPDTGIGSYFDDAGVVRSIRNPKDNIPTTPSFYLDDPKIKSSNASFDKVTFGPGGAIQVGPERIDEYENTGLTSGPAPIDTTGGNRTNDEVRSNPTGFRPGNTTANQNKTEGVNYSDKEPITTRHHRLLQTPEYQAALAPDGPSGLFLHLRLEEKDAFKDYYRIQYFESLVAGAREQIESKLFKTTNLQITPDIKSRQLWTPVDYVKKGSLYPGAIVSTVDQDDVYFFDKLINKLHSLIDEKILVKELLDLVEQITAGEIDSTRVRGTAAPQAKAVKGLDPRWPPIIERARELGADFRITVGYRSPERQNELYAQGRTKPGNIVTYVRGGRSKHQTGRAIDIVWRKGKGINDRNPKGTLYDPVELEKMARIFQQAGKEQGVTVKWGGDFKTFYDGPHLEII